MGPAVARDAAGKSVVRAMLTGGIEGPILSQTILGRMGTSETAAPDG